MAGFVFTERYDSGRNNLPVFQSHNAVCDTHNAAVMTRDENALAANFRNGAESENNFPADPRI